MLFPHLFFKGSGDGERIERLLLAIIFLAIAGNWYLVCYFWNTHAFYKPGPCAAGQQSEDFSGVNDWPGKVKG